MNPGIIISIDPGSSGAAVLRTVGNGRVVGVIPYSGDESVVETINRAADIPLGRVKVYGAGKDSTIAAVIERVWASPVMGCANSFSFGDNYGSWRLACKVSGIPVYGITPQKWMKVVVPYVEAERTSRKHMLKQAAESMFDLPVGESKLPAGVRITLANADALLLSEYAMRQLKAGNELGETL